MLCPERKVQCEGGTEDGLRCCGRFNFGPRFWAGGEVGRQRLFLLCCFSHPEGISKIYPWMALLHCNCIILQKKFAHVRLIAMPLHRLVFFQLDASVAHTPQATIPSIRRPPRFSCTQDGRDMHGSVIQCHCQSHFEDSCVKAGRQSSNWWISSPWLKMLI